jgi:hypothetical protein
MIPGPFFHLFRFAHTQMLLEQGHQGLFFESGSFSGLQVVSAQRYETIYHFTPFALLIP